MKEEIEIWTESIYLSARSMEYKEFMNTLHSLFGTPTTVKPDYDIKIVLKKCNN